MLHLGAETSSTGSSTSVKWRWFLPNRICLVAFLSRLSPEEGWPEEIHPVVSVYETRKVELTDRTVFSNKYTKCLTTFAGLSYMLPAFPVHFPCVKYFCKLNTCRGNEMPQCRWKHRTLLWEYLDISGLKSVSLNQNFTNMQTHSCVVLLATISSS